jgi:hypothetical protein
MMKGVTKKSVKKLSYTPENVGGGCMTGRIMTDSEAQKVSSFIAQYKAGKKPSSSAPKPKA